MTEFRHHQELHPEYQSDQSQLFDEKIVADWHTYVEDRPWDVVRQFETDKLFDRLSAKRVLDSGCGCGYHDILMAAKPGVEEVVGIDYSAASIAKANAVYLSKTKIKPPQAPRASTDVSTTHPKRAS